MCMVALFCPTCLCSFVIAMQAIQGSMQNIRLLFPSGEQLKNKSLTMMMHAVKTIGHEEQVLILQVALFEIH